MHVCPLMTSKALTLGFLPMQKLAMFARGLQRVWGWLVVVFCRRDPAPCCGWPGASVLSQNAQVVWAKGHYLRTLPECMGKKIVGPVGLGKTTGDVLKPA